MAAALLKPHPGRQRAGREEEGRGSRLDAQPIKLEAQPAPRARPLTLRRPRHTHTHTPCCSRRAPLPLPPLPRHSAATPHRRTRHPCPCPCCCRCPWAAPPACWPCTPAAAWQQWRWQTRPSRCGSSRCAGSRAGGGDAEALGPGGGGEESRRCARSCGLLPCRCARCSHSLRLTHTACLASMLPRPLLPLLTTCACFSHSPPYSRHAGVMTAAMVQVYDVEAPRLVRRFRGHGDRVTGLALAADSRWLMSSSMDGTLRVWDVPSAQCLQVCGCGRAGGAGGGLLGFQGAAVGHGPAAGARTAPQVRAGRCQQHAPHCTATRPPPPLPRPLPARAHAHAHAGLAALAAAASRQRYTRPDASAPCPPTLQRCAAERRRPPPLSRVQPPSGAGPLPRSPCPCHR